MLHYLDIILFYSVPPPIIEPTKSTNIITTFAGNITSSMVENISDSVTNSSDHPTINVTAAVEHANNKPANLPLILASVFGSLLGLCFIACIVGLMYKRHKKKYQFKTGRFTLARLNSVFQRYVCTYVINWSIALVYVVSA